ncbi:ParB/RepB/Spo0J family partition protein [Pseudomonas cedrina]|uniref:ParB/RepB/Spo0J family partition protein n=1 Tax=Pseudomonas cedrina TaxID=651740 RepID=UPI003ED8962B
MAKKLDLTSMGGFVAPPAPVNEAQAVEAGTRVLEVPIDDVMPDPVKKQPRKKFDQAKLERLAHVIEESQLNQPITVKPINADGKYIISMGERRWRACKLAGKKTIPIIVSDKTDSYDQVTENTEREPLTTMEIAEFIIERIAEGDKKGYIAKRLGMRAEALSQHVALATAPEFIQKLGNESEIGARTLYEMVQAHKEFPSEVERFAADSQEITRAGLARLVDGLRSRRDAEAEREAAKNKQGQEVPPQEETNPPSPDPDPKQELEPELPLTGDESPAVIEGANDGHGGHVDPQDENQTQAESQPSATVVKLLIDGREATLATSGIVSVVYEDTGEICQVELSTVQIVGVEEVKNEDS